MTDHPTRKPIPSRALDRVLARPNVADWDDGALLTLHEAAHLFGGGRALKVGTLRKAIDRRELRYKPIGRTFYVTPAAVREMIEPKLREPADAAAAVPPPPAPPGADPPPSEAEALLRRLREDRQAARRRPWPPATRATR